jgi:hypothetical protein
LSRLASTEADDKLGKPICYLLNLVWVGNAVFNIAKQGTSQLVS